VGPFEADPSLVLLRLDCSVFLLPGTLIRQAVVRDRDGSADAVRWGCIVFVSIGRSGPNGRNSPDRLPKLSLTQHTTAKLKSGKTHDFRYYWYARN
jgi:hypothetical protein